MGIIKNQIEKHPKLWEIFKFLLVGGLATLLDFAVMSVILYSFDPALYDNSIFKVFFGGGEPQTIATIVGTGAGFCAGLLFNYFLSVLFVFTGKDNSTQKAKTSKGFLMFSLLAAVGLTIHLVGMYVGYDLLGINEWIIKIVLTIVVLIFNYITRKKLLFNKNEEKSE